MKTNIGGDRLGSGNKMNVTTRNFERSTFDQSYIWRSTMSAGTLVPFLSEVGLPGDTFDINLNISAMTHPTIGPLFGKEKIQLDVFQCPIRLYNGSLHMNKLGIGLKMNTIKLPQIEVKADVNAQNNSGDNAQVNPSCILSYLNIRGIGLADEETIEPIEGTRYFNAISYLSYWDIYKNYYANKQEEIGFVIHNDMTPEPNVIQQFLIRTPGIETPITETTEVAIAVADTANAIILFENTNEPYVAEITIDIAGVTTPITSIWQTINWYPNNLEGHAILCLNINEAYKNQTVLWGLWTYSGATKSNIAQAPQLIEFPLENIDTMREEILKDTGNTEPFLITGETIAPYGYVLEKGTYEANEFTQGWSKLSSQEGLAIKTYQSDLFNNWISTEWLDGDNGVNAITAIDTSEGSFNIDTLNISNKVYNMLNRIALSGGSLDDWTEAVYSHQAPRRAESPIYLGSLIKELAFQEVVSLADTNENPLGTLGGKGTLTGKHKGGKIRVKCDEPCYIIGIISITPLIDYSQGNKWDVNLKTMDDFHKPDLDQIGFQDLITDAMSWQDTTIGGVEVDELIYKSAGKQPSWINYMTNVNQTRGNFAEKNQQMWMTFNRRYEHDPVSGAITDLTTYIDPVKYNYIFAETALDAQNYWMQIAVDMTSRRKMSSRQIPNL